MMQGGEVTSSKPVDALRARPIPASTSSSANPLLKILQVLLPVLVILAAIYLPRIFFPRQQ